MESRRVFFVAHMSSVLLVQYLYAWWPHGDESVGEICLLNGANKNPTENFIVHKYFTPHWSFQYFRHPFRCTSQLLGRYPIFPQGTYFPKVGGIFTLVSRVLPIRNIFIPSCFGRYFPTFLGCFCWRLDPDPTSSWIVTWCMFFKHIEVSWSHAARSTFRLEQWLHVLLLYFVWFSLKHSLLY